MVYAERGALEEDELAPHAAGSHEATTHGGGSPEFSLWPAQAERRLRPTSPQAKVPFSTRSKGLLEAATAAFTTGSQQSGGRQQLRVIGSEDNIPLHNEHHDAHQGKQGRHATRGLYARLWSCTTRYADHRLHETLLRLFPPLQALPSAFAKGSALAPVVCPRPFRQARSVTVMAADERIRLNNLSPEDGCRRERKRKGRGHAAGQVRTAA